MKALMFLSAFLLAPIAQAAELELFVDYNPIDQSYSEKYISTFDNPMTGDWLMQPHIGACYRGEAVDAMDLIQLMVNTYNDNVSMELDEVSRPMRIVEMGTHFDTRLNQNTIHLRLEMIQENGSIFGWDWPRIRHCK